MRWLDRSFHNPRQRNAIDLGPRSRSIPNESNGRAERDAQHDSRAVIGELRRVDLLNALTDEELGLLASAIGARQFGRSETDLLNELFEVVAVGAAILIRGHGTKLGPERS